MTHVDVAQITQASGWKEVTEGQQLLTCSRQYPQRRSRGVEDCGIMACVSSGEPCTKHAYTHTHRHGQTHTHRCEPHVNIHRQPDPDFYVPMGFILFACRTYVCHTVYTRLEHRLAHSVKNIKSLLELLACRYETAHVALIAQIPEFSADTLVRQSGPDVHRRIRL